MIENKSLGDRLNDYKNSPNQPQSPISNNLSNKISSVFITILSAITIAIKTLVFGYSTKLIFNTDWNFLGIVSIGLMIKFMMTYIYDLIYGQL